MEFPFLEVVWFEWYWPPPHVSVESPSSVSTLLFETRSLTEAGAHWLAMIFLFPAPSDGIAGTCHIPAFVVLFLIWVWEIEVGSSCLYSKLFTMEPCSIPLVHFLWHPLPIRLMFDSLVEILYRWCTVISIVALDAPLIVHWSRLGLFSFNMVAWKDFKHREELKIFHSTSPYSWPNFSNEHTAVVLTGYSGLLTSHQCQHGYVTSLFVVVLRQLSKPL